MTFKYASKLLGLSQSYLAMYKKTKSPDCTAKELYDQVIAHKALDNKLRGDLLDAYYDLSNKRLCFYFSKFVHNKGLCTNERSILSVFDYLLINKSKNLCSLKQQQKHVELLELYEEFKHEEKYTRIHSRA